MIFVRDKLVGFASNKLAREAFGWLEVGQVLPLLLLQLDDLRVLPWILIHKVLFPWDPENSNVSLFRHYCMQYHNLRS